MPEYTVTLLFWVVPASVMITLLRVKGLITPVVRSAIIINLAVLASIGFLLDLLFARIFFLFPDPSQVCGINLMQIPVEEFLFYILGFWFIIIMYVFCDEYFLRLYNRPDGDYRRFSRRIKHLFYPASTVKTAALFTAIITAACITKILLNPEGLPVPGYFLFLAVFAYIPYILFWKMTRHFVNFRALAVTVCITTLISIIWEVTLALPRGYWDYQHSAMLGVNIPVWNNLPIEAVTVWIFSSLIVLSYEFTKVFLHRSSQARVARNVPVLPLINSDGNL